MVLDAGGEEVGEHLGIHLERWVPLLRRRDGTVLPLPGLALEVAVGKVGGGGTVAVGLDLGGDERSLAAEGSQLHVGEKGFGQDLEVRGASGWGAEVSLGGVFPELLDRPEYKGVALVCLLMEERHDAVIVVKWWRNQQACMVK